MREANHSCHPINRPLEPGEEWSWCYIDRIGMLTPKVTGSTRIQPSRMSDTASGTAYRVLGRFPAAPWIQSEAQPGLRNGAHQ